MIPFDYNPRTRFVFGPGSIERIGALATEYGGRRVLLVSDPGIQAAGHVTRAEESIRAAGLECFTFTGVEENPTTRHVDAAAEFAREGDIDFIVGLGGGSSMDCAKGANFILSGGGRMADYWGVGKAVGPMRPMIAIPTTAGTGSEAQSFALIADATTHVKMACGDKKAACRAAILDPCLTLSQPREVAAISGIDAISHAVETYVTRRRNPISRIFSRRAWELLSENFAQIFRDPEDLEARGAMMLGACLAGLAIETSMLGATHACANPVTARYGTAHGRAIGVMLPRVIRHNAAEAGRFYAELLGGDGRNGASPAAAPETLAARIESMRETAQLPRKLSECGVEHEALPAMAKEASGQWTAQFNPRALSEAEYLELYEEAF